MAKCWLPYNIFFNKKSWVNLFFITSWTFVTYFHVIFNPYIFFPNFRNSKTISSEENWWFLSQSNGETNHWPLCCLVPGVLVSFCKVQCSKNWKIMQYKQNCISTRDCIITSKAKINIFWNYFLPSF